MGGKSKTFTERWREACETGPVIALPSNGPQMLMRMGVAKRSARCHMCFTPIVPGEDRVEFFVRFGAFRRYMRGGGAVGQICFVHAGCIAAFLEGTGKQRRNVGRVCVHCHREIEYSTSSAQRGLNGFPFIVSATIMSYICLDCYLQPMYQGCVQCGMWSYRHRMTSLLTNDGFLCYHCDDELEVVGRTKELTTVRSHKRDKLLSKTIKRSYEQAETWVSQLRAVR